LIDEVDEEEFLASLLPKDKIQDLLTAVDGLEDACKPLEKNPEEREKRRIARYLKRHRNRSMYRGR
jgi:hypothetical protein